jgi:hypothetical protein
MCWILQISIFQMLLTLLIGLLLLLLVAVSAFVVAAEVLLAV